MSKPLLVFAHKKEAQFFFNQFSYKIRRLVSIKYYETAGHYLLISGEGHQNAASALVKTLVSIEPCPSRVINLGVAGSLDSARAKCGKTYPVRAIGIESETGNYHLQLLPTQNQAGLLCLSMLAPVLDPADAKTLSKKFDIVDMEAGGLAGVCIKHDVPFEAYKVISDDAGHQSRKEVLSRANEYSEKLFHFFNKMT